MISSPKLLLSCIGFRDDIGPQYQELGSVQEFGPSLEIVLVLLILL